MAAIGKVYLTGAGPGDPGLLTLKAREVLEKANTVVYDYLVDKRILDLIPSGIKKICFAQDGQKNYRMQEKINRFLVKEAKRGRQVVRLKNGDPFIFSRGIEELLELAKNNVPYEVIPGITAGIAACEYAGIPVTQRKVNSCVSLITGSEAKAKNNSHLNWRALSRMQGTLIFYMTVGKLQYICNQLMRYGLDRNTPCCIVQRATTLGQKIIDGNLANIFQRAKKARIKPPAVLVVSKNVPLRKNLAWFDRLPLAGKRIVVTREKGGELSELLKRAGAQVIHFPTIKIKDNHKQLKGLSKFDWLIFTSCNAVRFFRNNLKKIPKNTKIACIGPATRKHLQGLGIKTDLVSKIFSSTGLIAEFKKLNLLGKRFLIVRSDKGTKLLSQKLSDLSARVKEFYAYRILPAKPDIKDFLQELKQGIDIITFLSSESARNFVRILGKNKTKKIIKDIKIISIGPETTKTLRSLGLKVDIQPKEFTIEALVNAMNREI
jgi:uroporphyrinogen III methyltransferase/synthase